MGFLPRFLKPRPKTFKETTMAENQPENKLERLKKEVSAFPDSPGVYLFKNPGDVVLYVGKAVSLKKRVASYFNQKGAESPKIRSLLAQVHRLDFVLTEDENQAFLLESNLIKRHRPRY